MATTNSAALTRVSPGVYRGASGSLVKPQGGVVNRPGVPVQNTVKPPPTNTNTVQPSPVVADTYKDPNRVRARIAWLQKNRPNDPEIARLNSWVTQFGNPQAEDATRTGQPVGGVETVSDQPPAAPAAPAAQPPSVPDFSSYNSPMTKALMDAMAQGMSTMQAYEPKYFEGSPLYQFQKDKGMRDLERLMAARGLTGSGAEVQANSDFLANINATESEKQRQYAEANRDRQQSAMQFIANFDQAERNALRDQWNTNLDRQTNISQFEANRGDARQALAVNFLNNVLGLQAQNDIARISSGGLGSQTDLTKALINAATQNTMAQAPRVSGGGGGAPPPPQPGNNSALMNILMNYGNNAGNNDVVNQILSLFK